MGFYARNFVYNDIPSEQFNLEIANLESGLSTNPGSGSVDIIDQFILRRPIPYFYSIAYNNKLEFPISFFSPDELPAVDLSYVMGWLFAQSSYKDFVVMQPDMSHIYLKAIFTDPRVIRAGNSIFGINATCILDSQFAYNYPETTTYNYANSVVSGSFIFYNNSHYSGYLYPSMVITTGSSTANISVVNETDDDREFTFENLSPYETIAVNNDKGIITSSLGYRRLSNFNKNFFRYIPGLNNVSVSGSSITKLSITSQFLRFIGG